MEAGYRELFSRTDQLFIGDQYSLNEGKNWHDLNSVDQLGFVIGNRYRRRVVVVAETFMPGASLVMAAAPTPDSFHDLRLILDKEQEHILLIEENNSRRDRSLDLGQELVSARKQFAERYRDRLFVIGGRLIGTEAGTWVSKPVEVVA